MVWECSVCETRFVDTRRCPECNVFTRRVGPGGLCPHCAEPVVIAELSE